MKKISKDIHQTNSSSYNNLKRLYTCGVTNEDQVIDISLVLLYLSKSIKSAFYIFIFYILSTIEVDAQDTHYALPAFSSLYQNPANTGVIERALRASLAFRQQWLTIAPLPFNNYYAGIDASLGAAKNIGIGINFNRDAAAGGSLVRSDLTLSLSHIRLLHRRKEVYFIFGLSGGWHTTYYDISKATFDMQYNGLLYDPTQFSGETFTMERISAINLAAGVQLYRKIAEQKNYNIAFAVDHLNSYNESYLGNSDRRFPRFTIQLQASIPLDKNLLYTLHPSILFVNQGGHNMFLLGSGLRWVPGNQRKITKAYLFGLRTRITKSGWREILSDAIIFQLGYEQIHRYKFMISYDANFSSLLPATKTIGAIELGIQSIFGKFSSGQKAISCPQF